MLKITIPFTSFYYLLFPFVPFTKKMLSKEQNGLHQAFQFLFNRKSKTTQEISPFTSRSNSNITINSLLSPIPTPSTSITYSEKEEPWRLLDDGHIHHDYFFMDRQDLYTMNDIIERYTPFLSAIFAVFSHFNLNFRDSYGFKRPTQWVQIKHLHQFDVYYQPILDEQQLNWNSMLNQCQGIYPPANNITRMYTFFYPYSFKNNNNCPLIILI